MKVTRGGETLHVFLNISATGQCEASLSGMKIQNISYSGYLVPLKEKTPPPPPPLQGTDVI
jgi:hypothetical protein